MPSHTAVYAPFCTFSRFRAWLTKVGFRVAALLLFDLCCSYLVQAQLPQPLVFSSGGAVALRNDQTGALVPVSGSPFPVSGGAISLDVKGRFLFVPGLNAIHMYQITDSTTGAYQEVPNSPFASPNTNLPMFIAVEPSGTFIAVVNRLSQLPGQSSIETFQIQTNPPALVPVVGSFQQLPSTVIGASQPPDARKFYLYQGPSFPQNLSQATGEEFDTVSVDPQTGFLLGISFVPDGSTARGYASDPQGRFIVLSHGELVGRLDVVGTDGSYPSFGLQLPQGVLPAGVWVDSTGSFLYAQYGAQGNVTHIFAIDSQALTLTETASSPLPNSAPLPSYSTSPTSPFEYGGDAQPDLIHAFTADPQTGYFVEAPGSPYTVPGGQGTLTFSIPQGQQGISGPAVSLSANSLSFGSVQVGSSSSSQTLTITSTGSQALSISSIQVAGADSAEFAAMDACHAPTVLQPRNFCSVSITFSPASPGSAQASLLITDNAPDSPQSVSLTGTAVAAPPPAPAITLSPNPVTFPAIPQGTASAPVTITITNSGNATLHISAVVVGGNNPADFTNPPNNCVAALAPSASCAISVTFAPLAAGQRSETITLSDDAPASPQVIAVSGNATPAASISAAPNGSTSATVSPGATATFSLLLTPDPSFIGTVSFACTGFPVGATCQVPPISVTQSGPVPFTVSVKTSGAALAIPRLRTAPGSWPQDPPFILLLLLVALFASQQAAKAPKRLPAPWLACVLFLCALGAAGCGGGAASPPALAPPPVVVTPQGVSTITITPLAVNAANKQLPLQPVQLQLTVN